MEEEIGLKMKEEEIGQTVFKYLVRYYKKLKGSMNSPKYFLVSGASLESGRDVSEVLFGKADAVLFDLIERNKFFGSFVPHSVEQADNQDNASLCILEDRGWIRELVELQYERSPTGLFILTKSVNSPFKYIATKEGFIQTANILGIPSNLEEIANTLYQQ